MPGWVTVKALLYVVAALLAVALLLGGALIVERADHRATTAELSAVKAERDTAVGNTANANRAHDVTKASLAKVQQALSECAAARQAQADAAAAARASQAAELRDANAVLARMTAQLSTLTRADPALAACMTMPLPPTLRGSP